MGGGVGRRDPRYLQAVSTPILHPNAYFSAFFGIFEITHSCTAQILEIQQNDLEITKKSMFLPISIFDIISKISNFAIFSRTFAFYLLDFDEIVWNFTKVLHKWSTMIQHTDLYRCADDLSKFWEYLEISGTDEMIQCGTFFSWIQSSPSLLLKRVTRAMRLPVQVSVQLAAELVARIRSRCWARPYFLSSAIFSDIFQRSCFQVRHCYFFKTAFHWTD